MASLSCIVIGLTDLCSDESDTEEDGHFPIPVKIPSKMRDNDDPKSTEVAITATNAGDFSRAMVSSESGQPFGPQPARPWPWSCNPLVMDSKTGQMLNTNDSKYLEDAQYSQQIIEYIDLGVSTPELKRVSFEAQDAAKLTELLDSSSLPQEHTRVLSVRVNQSYYGGPRSRSYDGFGVTKSTWLRILNVAMISPNAVELLHDKNGRHWSCTMYCAANRMLATTPNPKLRTPCA